MSQPRNDFTQGSIPRLVMRLSLPMIGAQIINALYSIVDRMYIGRIPGVGTLALTGVGLTFPFLTIVSAFAVLAGMGGAPLCSIARGEGKNEYAERIMGNAFCLLLLFGVTITAAALLVRRPVLYWFGASEQTFPFADEYATVYLSGSMLVMLSLGMNPFVNSQGFTRIGMLSVGIGALTNIVLDPLFIFVFGLGIRGAAYATLIAQACSAVWILRFLTGKRAILRLKKENIRLRRDITLKTLSLGASNFTMNMTDCIVTIVCNRTLKLYGGDLYVGVMTVISSVRQMLLMVTSGFGQGSQPVMGYNYGAKRYDRVRENFRFTTLVCAVYASLACLLTMLFPDLLLRIFTDDPELLSVGARCIRVYFCAFFMMSLQMAGQHSFVALGKSRQAIFFSLLRKAFIVAPLAFLLPRFTPLGVMGVFVAEPISDIVGSSACFLAFMLTVWPKLKD